MTLEEPPAPLVRIDPAQAGIAVDLRYAGANNIAGRPIYSEAICLLHEEAAAALLRAAALARAAGLRLCVLDAYRPPDAQAVLWRACPDPAYVARPETGSNHARGLAVDLTLIEAGGGAIDMGSAFDEMSPRSHHGAGGLDPAAQRARATLAGLMALAGFVHNPHEWWHYEIPGAAQRPILRSPRPALHTERAK